MSLTRYYSSTPRCEEYKAFWRLIQVLIFGNMLLLFCGRSSTVEHFPVTEEAVGSAPIARACTMSG